MRTPNEHVNEDVREVLRTLKMKVCQISCALDFVIKENASHIYKLENRINQLESTIHAHRAMHEHLLGLSVSNQCKCQSK